MTFDLLFSLVVCFGLFCVPFVLIGILVARRRRDQRLGRIPGVPLDGTVKGRSGFERVRVTRPKDTTRRHPQGDE